MTQVRANLTDDGGDHPNREAMQPSLKRGIAWSFLLMVLFFLSAAVYAFVYGVQLAITQPELVQGSSSDLLGSMITEHLTSYSDSLFGLSLVNFLLLVPVILLISNFKQQNFKQTLALRGFDKCILIKAVVLFCIYMVLAILVEVFFVDEADDFIKQINGIRSLSIAFSIVILAPIYEELIFRGYIFKVLRHTRLGASGTILLTSVLFLLLHLGQYQWPIMASLFLFSCLMGYLREKSGSVYLPILLHAVNSFVSAVLIVYLGLA